MNEMTEGFSPLETLLLIPNFLHCEPRVAKSFVYRTERFQSGGR